MSIERTGKRAVRFSAYSSLAIASAGSIYYMVLIWINKIPIVFVGPNPRAWSVFEVGLRLFVVYWLFLFPSIGLTSFVVMDLWEEISKMRRTVGAMSIKQALKNAAHMAALLAYFVGVGTAAYRMYADIEKMAVSNFVLGIYGVAVFVVTFVLASLAIGVVLSIALWLLEKRRQAGGVQTV